MRLDRRRLAVGLCIGGILCLLAGWNAAWDAAWGQTAGPTPTTGESIATLRISKTATPNVGAPNDLITFTIIVQNTRSVPATNVVVTDDVPDLLEIIGVSSTIGTATWSGQLVTVVIGTLEPGGIASITIQTRIRATAQRGDAAVNIAIVSADPNTSIASPPVAIGVEQPPPTGLPNTAASSSPNLALLISGALLLVAGLLLLAVEQRRVRISR